MKLDEYDGMDLPVDNPKNIRPELLTTNEFVKLVNPKGKYHSDGSYDTTLEKLNSYHSIGEYPKLLRTTRINGLDFQIRLGDDCVGIFNDNKIVGAIQDEWGCILIRVVQEFRGFHLGIMLSRIARTMFPDKTSGGFTQSGLNNFIVSHRETVRDALANGTYRKLILNHEISIERVKEIVASARLEGRLKKLDKNFNTNNPSDWLLYGEDGCFFIYDKKIKDFEEGNQFEDSAIKSFALIRFPRKSFGLILGLDAANDKLKSFMIALASTYADENGMPLYIDPEYKNNIPLENVEIVAEDMKSGYTRILTKCKKRVAYQGMTNAEAMWRKTFDKYGEFMSRIIELAHSRFE
jgi:hypothetical protein